VRLRASMDAVERAMRMVTASGRFKQTYQRSVLKHLAWQPIAPGFVGERVDQAMAAAYLTEVYRSTKLEHRRAVEVVECESCLQS
jgi:hypothetical protein